MKVYKFLILVETKLQHEIAYQVLAAYREKFKDAEIVVQELNISETKFESESYDLTPFNLNSFGNVFRSIKGIIGFSIEEEFDYCISSMYSSFNLIFVLSNLKIKHNILIDDGLATIKLKLASVKLSNKYYLRKAIVKTVCNLCGKRFLWSLNSIFSKVEAYYSIFEKSLVFKDKQRKIEIFSSCKTPKSVKHGAIILIGQPVVELNILNKSIYESTLKDLESKYEKIYYFSHPSETAIHEKTLGSCIKVIKPNQILEKYFLEELPEYPIVGFYSTALLNLRKIFPKHPIHYIYIEKLNINWVYELFEINEITRLN
jgi:hypothetical protein